MSEVKIKYQKTIKETSRPLRGTSVFRGEETGPIKPNQWRDDGRYWECVWYNNTITKVKLEQIDIEYTDGTTAIIGENEIGYIKY